MKQFEALRDSPRPARGQALDAKRTVEVPLCGHVSSSVFEPHFRSHDQASSSGTKQSIIVGIIHSQLPSSKFNMPILCAQSLRLPSFKFKMPILCTQSLRLPSSKFKGPILSTQSLRLPSSKSKRPILCTQSLRLPSSKFKRPILCTQSLRLLRPPSLKGGKPETAPKKNDLGRRDF